MTRKGSQEHVRRKGKDKAREKKERNGKYSSKHLRIIEEKLKQSKKNKELS